MPLLLRRSVTLLEMIAALAILIVLSAAPNLAHAQGIRNSNGVPYSSLLGCDGATPASAANPVCITGALAAGTTGGCTLGGIQTAATTNATVIKAAAGTWCGGVAINTTASLVYLRLYNLAAAPTCSSATGFVLSIPIPASTTGAGVLLDFGPYGGAFATGIGACITGGGSSTDNTNAVTGVYVNYGFK